jgi:BASS family bile acid:Na+ symporter
MSRFCSSLAGALLGSWRTILEPVGSRIILATIVVSVVMLAVGYFASVGGRSTREATALIQPCSNTGPAFAAVAIAFDNAPDVLGAVVAILLFQIVVAMLTATFLARGRPDAGEAPPLRVVGPRLPAPG